MSNRLIQTPRCKTKKRLEPNKKNMNSHWFWIVEDNRTHWFWIECRHLFTKEINPSTNQQKQNNKFDHEANNLLQIPAKQHMHGQLQAYTVELYGLICTKAWWKSCTIKHLTTEKREKKQILNASTMISIVAFSLRWRNRSKRTNTSMHTCFITCIDN